LATASQNSPATRLRPRRARRSRLSPWMARSVRKPRRCGTRWRAPSRARCRSRRPRNRGRAPLGEGGDHPHPRARSWPRKHRRPEPRRHRCAAPALRGTLPNRWRLAAPRRSERQPHRGSPRSLDTRDAPSRPPDHAPAPHSAARRRASQRTTPAPRQQRPQTVGSSVEARVNHTDHRVRGDQCARAYATTPPGESTQRSRTLCPLSSCLGVAAQPLRASPRSVVTPQRRGRQTRRARAVDTSISLGWPTECRRGQRKSRILSNHFQYLKTQHEPQGSRSDRGRGFWRGRSCPPTQLSSGWVHSQHYA